MLTSTDAEVPEITCPIALMISTDPGLCEAVNIDLLTPLATDNCMIATLMNDAPISFPLGMTVVNWIATDGSENSNSCIQEVTVEDHEPPVANCQPLAVQLDVNGYASITAAELNDGSYDACGIQSLALSKTDFSCENVGDNPVELNVVDNNNNQSSCQVTVTVQDNIAPQALCQNLTIVLDANGFATVSAAEVDNGSYDACGIQSLALSKTDFSCENVGDNPVELNVVDSNDNQSSCQVTVTVQDNIAPQALCQNLTIVLDVNGFATISAAEVDNGSYDACGIQSLALSKTDFSCADLGDNLVELSVTDINGNHSICTAIISVEMGTTLPVPWENSDIGQAVGETIYDPCEKAFVLSSYSSNYPIPLNADEQQMVYQYLCDSVELIAHLKNMDHPWAGIEIRESLTSDSKVVGIKTLGNLIYGVVREKTGNAVELRLISSLGHTWLRLLRNGDYFIVETSPDSTNWFFAFDRKINFNNCAYIGLFAESVNIYPTTHAIFDNVWISGGTNISTFTSLPNQVVPIADVETEMSLDIGFKIYPNPVKDVLNIDLGMTVVQAPIISILDVTGKSVYQKKFLGETSKFQIPFETFNMPIGLYIVSIRIKDRVMNKRFVKTD